MKKTFVYSVFVLSCLFVFIGNIYGQSYPRIDNSTGGIVNVTISTTFANLSGSAYGGAVYNDNNGKIDFQASVIFSSNSPTEDGGAIYNKGNSLIEFQGPSVIFAGNSGTNNGYNNGGAIYSDNSTINFNNTIATFIENTAGDYCNGGAILNTWGSLTNFTNSVVTFTNNSTGLGGWGFGDGGAISNHINSSVSFNGSTVTFVDNTAGYVGGAIYNEESLIEFSNSNVLFADNMANDFGGAIYNNISIVSFNSGLVHFNSNSAQYGAAIMNDASLITFSGSSAAFTNGTADYDAGAIYNIADSTVSFTGGFVIFENNSSNNGDGGSIFNEGVVEIAGSIMNFINNKAIAGAGGGVFAQAGSSITLEGSGNFIGNEAGSYGGAIYVSSSASVSIIANNGDIAFDNNKMNGSPNDIYIADWGVLNLGGAKDIYFKSGIGFNTTTSSMNIKVTKEGSGVVYLDYSNPYLSNLEFKEGSIGLHSAGSNSVGNQLTINELDASASGSQKIYMNVKINGQIDDESDKIRIIDKYEGNIEIAGKQVGTMGALTAGDGMKAVEFGENAVINGNFSLEGGKIDNGAYEIKMYKGDDATFSDWSASADPRDYYLRTAVSGAGGNPVLTDVYKTMANMPILNVLLARAGMNSLEKRLGDLRGFGVGIAGVWSRVYGVNEKVKDMVDTNLSLMGIEAGFDVLVNREEKNKIYVGGMFGYTGALEAKTKLGVENSNGNGRGVSVGLYGSWIEESGWFVDLASRYFITSFDMANYSSIGDKLEYKPERDIWATGIEAGKTFKVEQDENKYIRIEPKLEVQYLMAGDDKTTVTNGVGSLEYGKADYVKGKANILIGYAVMKNGEVKYEPYIEIGYNHELAGKGKMSYSGVGYESNISGGGFEGALGVDVKVSENIYIYGQGNIESGEKFSAIGANVGVRIGIGEKGKEAAVVETKAKPAVVESTATAAVEKEDKDIEEAKARRKASIKAFSIKAASFGVGKSELTPKAKEDIKEMAQEIKKYEYTSVTIEGHTDASGKAEVNQELSEKRAKSVREEFVKEGIEESKVRIIGFGHRMSVDTNETAAGRANNRRVEIFVE
ncbi:autotransporter outer membrane beta-barrel domain-containing protein [Endomicrobium proavitum]|uniref:OmpA-like domain-containing protein n=1 Tax=Endomicrobium proavitum TaxID=1408281 RepID=A0A0G3WFR6_9BACT|nr:autotransporter outer membrane beta-barrel domain-containing protein [Endomicrobium proavitum]AKL97446.1 exported protein of unknown function [Endomicrobium proavitum]